MVCYSHWSRHWSCCGLVQNPWNHYEIRMCRIVSHVSWTYQEISFANRLRAKNRILSLSKFHVENHMTSDRHSMWNQKAGNAGIRATSVADFSNDSSSGSPRAPIGIALIRFLPRQIAKVFHCGLEVLVNFLILRIDWPIVYGTQRVKIIFPKTYQ